MVIKASRPDGVAHHRWKVDKKFRPIFHSVQIYKLAKAGLSDHAISKALGIAYETYKGWHGKYPALYKVAEDARGEVDGVKDFSEYVYGQLSEEQKALWDRIRAHEKARTLTKEAVEELFAGKGKSVRQSLFIHAWIASNFNASEACRKVGIAKETLQSWCTREPEFRKLFEEIDWHKGNFFEGALVKLVRSGDAAAILFANKTFNRDRGYAEKTVVENTTEVNINTQIPLEELDLDAATLTKILKAQRKYLAEKARQAQPASAPQALPAHVEDAEILKVTPSKKPRVTVYRRK
jgi:hypothetical protein